MTRRFPFFKFDPLTRRKLQRFRSIRRGYVSFLILAIAIVLSFAAELLVNSRALVVRYEGRWYFPTYGAITTTR
jgi:microcin C transport system permease protein